MEKYIRMVTSEQLSFLSGKSEKDPNFSSERDLPPKLKLK